MPALLDRPIATAIQTKPRKADIPEDFGHHTRKCERCDAWINRYHEAPEALCYPCLKPARDEATTLAELMAEAPGE